MPREPAAGRQDMMRKSLDVLPNWDRRLKLLHGPQCVAWRLWEDAEVRRLRATLPVVAPATVDVVLPTYRRPALLHQAVESVLAQTVSDLRLIVVDDGGGETDGLPHDRRIVVVPLRRNTALLGVVNNVGLRLGSSPYVALLNDDNTWRLNHVEAALEVLESGSDIVYTGMRRHTVDDVELDVLIRPFERRAMRREAFTDSSTLVAARFPGMHFSRARRGRGAFPREDWEFVWRYSRQRRVKLVPKVTVDYLVHDGSYLTDWTEFWRRRADSERA